MCIFVTLWKERRWTDVEFHHKSDLSDIHFTDNIFLRRVANLFSVCEI